MHAAAHDKSSATMGDSWEVEKPCEPSHAHHHYARHSTAVARCFSAFPQTPPTPHPDPAAHPTSGRSTTLNYPSALCAVKIWRSPGSALRVHPRTGIFLPT